MSKPTDINVLRFKKELEKLFKLKEEFIKALDGSIKVKKKQIKHMKLVEDKRED